MRTSMSRLCDCGVWVFLGFIFSLLASLLIKHEIKQNTDFCCGQLHNERANVNMHQLDVCLWWWCKSI